MTGGVSIDNVDGNANVAGRFDLKGAALESFVWQRDGRSVATGTLDLSANFEATGRSPAGLVSTVTGGGVLAVHDGEARYVNPEHGAPDRARLRSRPGVQRGCAARPPSASASTPTTCRSTRPAAPSPSPPARSA